MFSANIHGLRNRIVRIYLRTFHNERLPLVTHYGALIGLCEMGKEVRSIDRLMEIEPIHSVPSFQMIEEMVFPIIRIIGDRIVKLTENPPVSPMDKITTERITAVIMVSDRDRTLLPHHFRYFF